MSAPHDDLPAMRELREGLRAAAHRQAASHTPRRRLRRGGLALAFVALLIGGVAGAASLLSVGDPVPDRRGKQGKHLPAAPGSSSVAVMATDPKTKQQFGVAPYTDRAGQPCAIAGQLRVGRLGLIMKGVFHPYASATSGACGSLRTRPLFGDVRYFQEPELRSVVYGRARQGVREVTLILGGQSHAARTGHGGTFVFLLEGRVVLADIDLSVR